MRRLLLVTGALCLTAFDVAHAGDEVPAQGPNIVLILADDFGVGDIQAHYPENYDQGNLNHVGGGLTGVAGTNRWKAMGSAGIRPKGDDHFKSAFEPWRGWGRYPSPGYMFLYTYWMDMKRDRDGNYWGNMLGPADDERMVLGRDKWHGLEHMIQVNDPGEANGELAAWIDGKLYIHCTGFRWRTTRDVKLKRFGIGVYVHSATRDNTVWYDDVALSTGYIGPLD